jgi:RNA polymerase-binding protein DksA
MSPKFSRFLVQGGTNLEKQVLDTMKKELLRQREELLRHLENDSEDFLEIAEGSDPKDVVDLASDDVDRKNLEALNVVESRKLQLLENALSRIQNNRYGVCMECGQPIPLARLEAVPYALFCITCQAKKDRQGR